SVQMLFALRDRRDAWHLPVAVATEPAARNEQRRAAVGRLEHRERQDADAACMEPVVEQVTVRGVVMTRDLDPRITRRRGLGPACIRERHRRGVLCNRERGEQALLLVRAIDLPGAEAEEECEPDGGQQDREPRRTMPGARHGTAILARRADVPARSGYRPCSASCSSSFSWSPSSGISVPGCTT